MLITIEEFLTRDEVARFRRQLDAADWQDGVQTAGALARSRKRNLQLADDAPPAISLGNEILRKAGSHPLFVSAALPRRIHPPRFNKYCDGGGYGSHIDSALMRLSDAGATIRSDLSVTLFLSEPDEYEGGELEIEGAFGVQSVKLAAGDMVIYLASNLHRVTPVTQGARLASFFWVESFVRDDGERTILFDLDQAIQGVTPAIGANDDNLVKMTGVYHNLLRRWALT
ncbi:Fe2+-dependent dioxygenase [Emcibacter sp. SYSU 3D8]|uniref:Fe2+-dependent dioxygenase n=1 Tax=Emcibacter sp. SYSU 3D8 TaxID=3133969 RepID=UPI0031FE8D1B